MAKMIKKAHSLQKNAFKKQKVDVHVNLIIFNHNHGQITLDIIQNLYIINLHCCKFI